MYHFIKDKIFLKNMRNACSGIINQLVQIINNEQEMIVDAHLVGSGAKNLETQNGDEPVDLDYNLVLISTKKYGINNCKQIKEYVRKAFNKVLKKHGLDECQDSTSALTTSQIVFKKGNKTPFSIDLAIVVEDKSSWFRLIHEKTGNTNTDKYYWNEGPNSKGLAKKVKWIKDNNLWDLVRDAYLEKKNMYLKRQDYNHPSFICYIEAVNEIYTANK